MNPTDQPLPAPIPDAVADESFDLPAPVANELTPELLDLESAARMAIAWLPQEG